ncbi:MAG: AAA family ATPase [Candidatus Riflebacteria bacterium]|nr:AAA family ATPase [Candidatus Riflebacteria bacterium]
MKIIKLRFNNINSLAGEWEIDFTDPNYLDGIFVITGPTGAGKSSILDALCLALYGSTPRLGNITQNTNEVMSRQTAESSAELTFSTQAGSFVCSWRQHRAHKKADGKLSLVRREIAYAESGEIIASSLQQVNQAVIEITGMDFERFTRSMLLAQGGFAVFLQARPDERAPILEQITGTQIYSEISIHVHERNRLERDKLEILKAEMAGIMLLGEDEIGKVRDEIAAKATLEQQQSTQLAVTGQALQWLNGLRGIEGELQKLEVELEQALKAFDSFAGDRQRLHKAQQASEFDADFAALTSLRQNQQEALKSLGDIEKRLPERQQALTVAEKSVAASELVLEKSKEAQKAEQGHIRQIRALDAQIGERSKAYQKLEKDLSELKELLADASKKQKKTADSLKDNTLKLEKAQQYIEANKADANLVSEFAALKDLLTALSACKKKQIQSQELVEKAVCKHKLEEKNLAESEKELRIFEKSLKAVMKRVEEQNAEIKKLLGDRHLREYRSEQVALTRELALLKQIESLKDERRKLEDGKPCVLCGSLDHPYARGNVPPIDAAAERLESLMALLNQAEQLEDSLKEFVLEEKNSQKTVSEAEKKFETAKHKLAEAKSALAAAGEELEASQEQLQQQKASALLRLSVFGIEEISEDLLGGLSARLNAWQEAQQGRTELEKRAAELTAELKGCESLQARLNEDLAGKTVAFEEIGQELSALTGSRKGLYGDKDTDVEELKFEKAVQKADSETTALRNQLQQHALQLNETLALQTSLKATATALQLQLVESVRNFACTLLNSGFTDEEQFKSVRMAKAERDVLLRRSQELDNRKVEIGARLTDAGNRLKIENEKQLTDQPVEELQKRHDSLTAEIRQLGQEIGAFKQRIEDNDKARSKFSEKSALIEAQKAESWRWSELHSLIGSSDGKKFRNIAQGLTFAVMIGHANRQLRQMSDRYQLVRDPLNPLDLNIIDNYQAGEQRSIKNLSGGESFIVSLALALGLSNMASRNVRVDSLFLDEGFGTLDEDALESAIEALSGLHQEGKLIGIISHVSTLKERIGTQISVEPLSGGRSQIKGPGCRKI